MRPALLTALAQAAGMALPLQQELNAVQAGLGALLPHLALLLLSIVVLLVSLRWRTRPFLPVVLSLVGLLALVVALLFTRPAPASLFMGMLHTGGLAWFMQLLTTGATIVFFAFSLAYKPLRANLPKGEYAFLILSLLLGAWLLAMAQHGLMLYLAIEGLSIPAYVLVAYRRSSKPAAEAGLKYVILGAAASALMLYGLSLLYGLTGTLYFNAGFITALAQAQGPAALLALALVLGGLAYKVAAVPFHFWAPDAYQAALTPITTLVAVVPKLAGFAVLVHLTSLFAEAQAQVWQLLMGALALASLFWGNLAAFRQQDFKRLMAYSGVAQAGFVFLPIATGAVGATGATYYLLWYAVGTLVAFLAAARLASLSGSYSIDTWKGLGRSALLPSLALAVALISLTGLPPTAGFPAKLYLFAPLWQAYQAGGGWFYLLLLAAGVLNTVLALFYYLRPLVALFLSSPTSPPPASTSTGSGTRVHPWLVVLSISLLLFGIAGFDALLRFVSGLL